MGEMGRESSSAVEGLDGEEKATGHCYGRAWLILKESKHIPLFSIYSQIIQAGSQITHAGGRFHSHRIQVTPEDCSQAEAVTFSIRYT